MDFRNKWAVHVLRTIFALFLLFAGIAGLMYLFGGSEMPEQSEAMLTAMAGLTVSGLIYGAKVVEIVAGLLLLSNFRPALGNLLIAPITVAIMIYHVALMGFAGIWLVLLMVVLNAYLGYVYWEKYAQLFVSR